MVTEISEATGGIKKAVRPKKIRTTPADPAAEGLGELQSDGTGSGAGADVLGPAILEQPATEGEQPRRGRPAGSHNKAKAAAAPAVTISPDETAFVYDGLGSLEAWAAVKFFGVPADLAVMLHYSPEEKASLADPTSKVLSKYLPSMGRFKDEAALILTLYAIHQAKMIQIGAAMQDRAAALAAAPGPVAVSERPQ